MKIIKMKCNHITNPLGFRFDSIVLSWVPVSETSDFQSAARVEVSTCKDFSTMVYDSGKDESLDSICCKIPMELQPRTRYYWRVSVWTGDESCTSDIAWFETSKMDELWKAQWIAPAEVDNRNPAFRKTFYVDESKKIVYARAYAAAAGVYELELNGKKAGNEYLAPFLNQYKLWMQYQTYDVTDLLIRGINAIGALVGEGWYRGRFGLKGGKYDIFGDKAGFLCELVIQYDDGTCETIFTDTFWQTTSSFITASSIYDGETQDTSLLIDGWSTANVSPANHSGNEIKWGQPTLLKMDMSLLTARLSLPVIVKEILKPSKVIITPAGETLLDMGQNMVGGFMFDADLPAGNELKLQFGELLQNGNFYQENLRTAKQTFTYISDGQPKTVRQYFTYFGYRFVNVVGWIGDPQTLMKKYTGTVIYSDLERTGYLETSNPKVNQLYSNALWGQKGNFLDIPTDCPQRDERMGWTGDAQVFCAAATFNMDTYAFYRKYLYDMSKEQGDNEGKVPVIVPCILHSKEQSSAWSDATAIIPWTTYVYSGDASILKEHFPAMKDYIESIRSEDTGGRNLWTPAFSFGDWLAQDGLTPISYFGGTSTDLISSAYYCYSTRIVAKAANVLGYEKEAVEYGKLADDIRAAYQKEFITDSGRLAVDTQTAAIVTLFMDLASEKSRERIISRLYDLLKSNNFYLKTGFVGTPYICRVLSEIGHNDVSYKLLLNEELPSWLYCVNMGATTIWERWNSVLHNGLIGELGMNSLNHYAYGSIAEWMYRNMCGINPIEEYPGFRRVRIAPQPDIHIRFAKARFESPVGTYESGWQIQADGSIRIAVEVPFGGTAEVILPDSGMEPRVLKRGKYSFEYMPLKRYEYHYSTYVNSAKDLLDNPETAELAEKVLPGIKALMARNIIADHRLGTLRDLMGFSMFPFKSRDLDMLDEALYNIKVSF